MGWRWIVSDFFYQYSLVQGLSVKGMTPVYAFNEIGTETLPYQSSTVSEYND